MESGTVRAVSISKNYNNSIMRLPEPVTKLFDVQEFYSHSASAQVLQAV